MKKKRFKKISLLSSALGALLITTPLVLTSCNDGNQTTQPEQKPDQKPDDNGNANPGGGSGTEQEKTSYTISLTSHLNEVKLSKTEAKEGEEVSLTWDGNSEAIYSFSYKDNSGKVINISNNKFVMPNYEVKIDVVVKYKITANYDDTKGNLYINNQVIGNNASIEINENSTISYKVEANQGYKLEKISGIYTDNSEVIFGNNSFDFKEGSLTISVSFAEDKPVPPTPQEYTISVDSNYESKVELSKKQAQENEEVTISWIGYKEATVEFYYFDNNQQKVVITNNKFVMPNYSVSIQLTVTYKMNVEISNGIFYDDDSDNNIPNGTNIVLEVGQIFNYRIEADQGYKINSVEVYRNGAKIETLPANETGSYTLKDDGNVTIKVVCAEKYVNHSIKLNSHQKDIQLSNTEAKYNQEVTLTWTGNKDAKVTYYLIDKDNKTEIIDNKFTMPDNEVSIDVKVEYKVTLDVNYGGTIFINNKESVDGDSFYLEEGKSFNYQITPKDEKKIKSIVVVQNNKETELDKDIPNNTYTLSTEGNLTFKVKFASKVTTTIKDVATVLKEAMQIFNIYDIIPESFKEQNLADKDGNKTNISHDSYKNNFMSVSDVPIFGMGAQLRQFLNASELILNIVEKAKPIYDIASTIGTMWQAFFNKEPDNGTEWESSTTDGNVKFKITLSDEQFRILLKGYSANLEITKNLNTKVTITRIQLNDANSIKIVQSKDSVEIGLRSLGAQRMMLSFDLSNKDEKIGTLYNFVGKDGEDGSNDLGLTTMSAIKITDDYVSVIGKKGDFMLPNKDNRNVEMYETSSGKFIGSQVTESNNLKQYNTNWYPLGSINGLDTFKIVEFSTTKDNGSKFINGSSKEFDNGRNVVMGVPVGSRQYEFEQKTVYVYITINGKIEEQKIQIPLFFMQDEYEKDSNKGFTELNKKNSSNLSNSISQSVLDRRDEDAIELKTYYNNLNLEEDKNQQVLDFIGTADSWFNI